jgi:hypothetical protein
MHTNADSLNRILRVVTNPKFVLLALASVNLFSVPVRYGALCFYNWSSNFHLAFAIFVASLALWAATWWSNMGAAVLTGLMLYESSRSILEIFGFLPVSSNETDMMITSEDWIVFMQNHPEVIGQFILVAVIFFYSVICLGDFALNKHRSLNT